MDPKKAALSPEEREALGAYLIHPPQSAESDARCNVCGQSLNTFPCPVSWDSEHRPRHDEIRPIPPARGE